MFLVFILIQPAASGKQPQATQADKTQKQEHEVVVTLKLIQVYVTDNKGNPVPDLEKSDFDLYDNGQLQDITGFEKHFVYAPKGKKEESRIPSAQDIPSDINRKYLFLIDLEKNDLEGIAKSRNAAIEFIDTKAQPSDEIALFSFSFMRGLTLHEYLTADHKKVRSAIYKIQGIPGKGGGWGSYEMLGHSVMNSDTSSQYFSYRSFTLRLASSIRELAQALRHIPGKKNIILFSRGYGDRVLNRATYEADIFLDMIKDLASANCPVFSVYTITGMEKIKVLPEGALDYLSKFTGGKYYPDVNYYSKIAEDIQNATSNYYVLGYSIGSKWDGEFHDIKVEVKKKGYKVYAQKGYFNPLPFIQLSSAEKHYHLLAVALGENAYFEQHMNFSMIALPFSDKKELNTILISEIQVQGIRDTIGDNTEYISLIFDQNKNIMDSQRMAVNWEKDNQSNIFHYSTTSLEPGWYDCRVVIRNLENGKAAVGACSIAKPEIADEDLKIYPPLLLIPGVETRYHHVFDPEKNKKQESFSLFQVFPFPQMEYVPLIDKLTQGEFTISAALRCVWTGVQEPEIQISAWLESEASLQRISVSTIILSSVQKKESDVLFLEFEFPELQAGRYLLHIMAEDMVTKSRSQTTSRFSVK